jgi:hypothetical protein
MAEDLFSPPSEALQRWMFLNRRRRVLDLLEEKMIQADKRGFATVKVPVDTLRWLLERT